MALTQISTAGVKDDAVTSGKIPANAVGSSELADNAVDTAAIADQAVALSKLPHGDGSNDGKFLRANNGADPSFETVSIPAGTTINNNADNRVITGSGTANTLNGEANLTFSSSLLVSDGNGSVNVGGNYALFKRTSANTNYINAPLSDADLVVSADNNVILATNHSADFNSNERMRIDSSGKVGIGETTLDALLVIKGNSDASTTPSIRLKDGSDTREAWISNTAGDLVLANGGNDNTPHCQLKMFDGNIMQFNTANTERMRITSSGLVGIGTTNPSGTLDVVGSNPVTAEFKTTNGSGGYIAFQMGGSGANIGYLGDSQQLVSTGGAAERLALRGDHGIELVAGVNRKVLIDSDGMKFGTDTAADNALDDYEEGSWTPAYSRPNMTLGLANQFGRYVKVGKVVHIVGKLNTTSESGSSSGGPIIVTGLPFTVRETRTALSVRPSGWSNDHPSFATFELNQTHFELVEEVEGNPSGSTDLTGSRFAGGTGNYLWFGGTYFTDT